MRSAPPDANAVFGKPTHCPFCRSTQVSTTGQAITEATYWRCDGCGQIWNQSRLLAWKVR